MDATSLVGRMLWLGNCMQNCINQCSRISGSLHGSSLTFALTHAKLMSMITFTCSSQGGCNIGIVGKETCSLPNGSMFKVLLAKHALVCSDQNGPRLIEQPFDAFFVP
jgi:hypothetical protein